MNSDRFLNVVPKGVRIAAWSIGACIVVAGGIVVLKEIGGHGYGLAGLFMHGLVVMVFGLVVTTWILGVGFVYADARRRAMRPILWSILVILLPHLVGFVLYFVIRQPLASSCIHCGQTISPAQPFCSWCGTPQETRSMSTVPPEQIRTQG
jgi:hypothetical protein